VGPRAVLDAVVKRKIPRAPIVQPVRKETPEQKLLLADRTAELLGIDAQALWLLKENLKGKRILRFNTGVKMKYFSGYRHVSSEFPDKLQAEHLLRYSGNAFHHSFHCHQVIFS
jgi:hypothetical protein